MNYIFSCQESQLLVDGEDNDNNYYYDDDDDHSDFLKDYLASKLPTKITANKSGSEYVIEISFQSGNYDSYSKKKRRKTSRPLLKAVVLGEYHTWTDVGKLLFQYHLHEILQEDLSSHLWRFQTRERKSFDPDLPLLSPQSKNIISAGSELLFHYDEGSPTIIEVTIERIYTIPEESSLSDYPIQIDLISQDEKQIVKQRVESLATMHTTTTTAAAVRMDEAFPRLSKVLLGPPNGMDIGIRNAASSTWSWWGRVWGGENVSRFHCIEAFEPFTDIDEALLTFERGLEKQQTTDEARVNSSVHNNNYLNATVNAIPSHVPKTLWKEEYGYVHIVTCGSGGLGCSCFLF